jgi:hypothetical protein
MHPIELVVHRNTVTLIAYGGRRLITTCSALLELASCNPHNRSMVWAVLVPLPSEMTGAQRGPVTLLV